ncbi:hypothetical protein [Vibrio splendidus]|uniref:hypothetical protein n=1 Tax=Vibrio splendidus TaxID=29497 RepID=UPI00080E41FD|nr:hypothetical protein [Vibrio splendidus]OCH61891.1 hypothetical protein A6D94_17100 [Vibrio splendidus]
MRIKKDRKKTLEDSLSLLERELECALEVLKETKYLDFTVLDNVETKKQVVDSFICEFRKLQNMFKASF